MNPTPRPGSSSGRSSSSSSNYREGISGDGFRGPPPPEVVEKMSRLSEDQRERLIKHMAELRERGVSSEERRGMFVRLLDRALQERR